MITAEMLVTANAKIKPLSIHGRNYAEVFQRVNAFRGICPNGAIKTEMLSNEGGVCIFRATVLDDAGNILGTGTAYEREGNSNINKTSYIENCETSAVGRALGMCGIGADVSIASADEVMNAIVNEAVEKKVKERMALEKANEVVATANQHSDAVTMKGTISDEDFAKALLNCKSRNDCLIFKNTYALTEAQTEKFLDFVKKHYPKNGTPTAP
jgi:hypothetical protein